jgi:peptidyl-prolyl cis-trans isomerase SurA
MYTAQDGKSTYKLLYLRSVTDAHKANLAQDLPKLKENAQVEKTNRTVSEWFEKKRKNTFVRIDPEFQSCSQLKEWVSTTQTAQASIQ